MKLILAVALSLLVGGGVGYFLAYKPSVDWSAQGPVFKAALDEVFAQQSAPKELVEKVSTCLADKVVAHLSAPEAACCLKAPTNTVEALQVIDSCVGPAAGLYFQECLAGSDK